MKSSAGFSTCYIADFPIGRRLKPQGEQNKWSPAGWKPAIQQVGSLRYSRLEACATFGGPQFGSLLHLLYLEPCDPRPMLNVRQPLITLQAHVGRAVRG